MPRSNKYAWLVALLLWLPLSAAAQGISPPTPGSSAPCAAFGTTAGTCAQGNDSRITGAVQSGGALGTPSSGTLTNATGLPLGSGITISGGTEGNTLYHGAANTPAEGPMPGMVLLAFADNVNFNATGDTQVTVNLPPGVTNWRIASNAAVGSFGVVGLTGSFTTAKVGLYSAASQGGTNLVAQSALTGITSPGINNTANSALLTTVGGAYNFTTLFINVGTAQGGTATGNVYIYGFPLP